MDTQQKRTRVVRHPKKGLLVTSNQQIIVHDNQGSSWRPVHTSENFIDIEGALETAWSFNLSKHRW